MAYWKKISSSRFLNTTKKLNLKPFKKSSDTDINQITSVFKNQVSIRKIQECFPNSQTSKQMTLILDRHP